MFRSICLLFLSVVFLTPAAWAQPIPVERSREAVGTLGVTHGKHKYNYLAYEVNGKIVKTGVAIPEATAIGSKYIIAYDTAHPMRINTFDFTRPVFDTEETTRESTARVLQTNFGRDIRYGRQKTLWIKYQYYDAGEPEQPVKVSLSRESRRRNRKKKMLPYFGYLALPRDAQVDTAGMTDKYFKVLYSADNPGRSILHYTERVTDTLHAPGYKHQLNDRKIKTFYTEVVLPVGFFMFNTYTNYNSFTFRFADPNTGTVVSNTARPFRQGPLYGGTLQLPYVSLYRHNGIITATPLSVAFGNGANVNYLHLGPSIGYQKQLTRRIRGYDYVLYPAVKAAAAINVSYSSLWYDLGALTSANGKDLTVNGRELGATSSASYSRRALRVAPEVGMYLRCSRTVEFRLSAVCNIEALHYENIRFSNIRTKNSDANSRHLDDYLSDEQGNPIAKDLFMPVPLISFRLECAFGGGH